jgi:hydroxymethylbilane synthase
VSDVRPLRIATRGSALARMQARLVADALSGIGIPMELVIVETDGDRRAADTPWSEGAFVAAIERALLAGRADIAVHSAKDVPTDEHPALVIGAYLERADPRDALVVGPGIDARSLDELPPGARVGTDSPRRTGFVRARRPDLVVHPLHGNVDTRLARLDRGESDALVLACAGLDRLGRGGRIAERLPAGAVPPAPGQGAIAVQGRRDDAATLRALARIDHRATRLAVEAERALLRAAGGGCRSPIGALATIEGETIRLTAGVVGIDGGGPRRLAASGPVADRVALAERLGRSFTGPRRIAPRGATDRPIVVVTRAAHQVDRLEDELARHGVRAIRVPAIEIRPQLDDALLHAVGRLHRYAWVVVTSTNGADSVLRAAERVEAELGAPSWAAIGVATAASLDREGIVADHVAAMADGRELARRLPIEPGQEVLVVRGDLAGDVVATTLAQRGAVVRDVVGYRTVEAPPSSKDALVAAIDASPSAVLFTSGSTVRGLVGLADGVLGRALRRVPAICLGPRTADEARHAGFRVLAVASDPTDGALAMTAAQAVRGDATATVSHHPTASELVETHR